MSEPESVVALLQAFREAVRLATSGAPLRTVVDGFGPFGELQERSLKECNAASVYPETGPASELTFQLSSGIQEGLSVPCARGDVLVLTLIFQPGLVRLGDLAEVFGSWYRDPPEPEECSYANAYFNPALINESRKFFLSANFRDFASNLKPDSIASELSLSYRDDRYAKDTPW